MTAEPFFAYPLPREGWVICKTRVPTRHDPLDDRYYVGTAFGREAPSEWEVTPRDVRPVRARPRDGRENDPTREGVFQSHNCSACANGELPCRTRVVGNCGNLCARND